MRLLLALAFSAVAFAQGVSVQFGGSSPNPLVTSPVGLISCQVGASDILSAATINTTETAFATTYSIPAGYLILNKRLRVQWTIETITSAATAPSQRGRIRMGGTGGASPTGTIVYDTGGAVTPTANLANRTQTMNLTITGTTAAGAAADVIYGYSTSGGIAATAYGTANAINQPVASVTNGALSIYVTMTFGTNTAGNSVQILDMCVYADN